MRYVEITEALNLPGRVEKLLSRSLKITLKDGRIGVLTAEPRNSDNQTATLDQATSIALHVEVDGALAGSMHIHPNRYPPPDDDFDMYKAERGSWSVSSVDVDQKFRRQGIATAMYDTLARAGMKILASGSGRGGKLLPDGSSLWDTRRTMKGGRWVYPYPMIWKPKRKPLGEASEDLDTRTQLFHEIDAARVAMNTAKDARDPEGWRTALDRFNRAVKALRDLDAAHETATPEPERANAYAGEHEAPDHESGSPLHDLKGVYPADFYTGRAKDYGENQSCINLMLALHNRPNAQVKVYRSIPKDAPRKINPGDWLTIDRRYAVEHGRDNLRNNYVIVSKTVYARDLFNDGNAEEWGYDPQPQVRRR